MIIVVIKVSIWYLTRPKQKKTVFPAVVSTISAHCQWNAWIKA